MDGTEWLEEVTEDTTVEKLKERCLKHVGYWAVCVSLLLFFILLLLHGMLSTMASVNCQCQCHWLCIYSQRVDLAIYNLAGWLPLSS